MVKALLKSAIHLVYSPNTIDADCLIIVLHGHSLQDHTRMTLTRLIEKSRVYYTNTLIYDEFRI